MKIFLICVSGIVLEGLFASLDDRKRSSFNEFVITMILFLLFIK